ncbi:MAG: family 16 glycosylhydrolase [Acholeplasmataceae bacterium]
MRKFLIFNLIVLSILLATSCQQTSIIETPTPTPTEDIIGSAPVFSGVTDLTLYTGEVFDPLEGVTAFDAEDGDLTSLIIILGQENIPLVNQKLSESGTFEITYVVRDSDLNTVTVTRTLTVLAKDSDNACDVTYESYVLTWCDDFTAEGDNLNQRGIDLDKWAFQIGTGASEGLNGWGNNEQQYYRSENAFVRGGNLIIEAKEETFNDMPYTSARLFTRPTFGQRYGRFEALIKLPVGQGLWPAFWLMPVDNVYGGWANSGEIDIMEARGRLPLEASSALHFGGSWPNNAYTSRNYAFSQGKSIADFNLYTVEWEPDVFRFYVNNELYHTVTSWYNTGFDFPAPFDQEFYIILNLAVGGTFDGNRLPPSQLFLDPVEMVVAYVRVYQKES